MNQRLHMPLLLAVSVVGMFFLLSGLRDMFYMADSYAAGSGGRFLWMLIKVAFGTVLLVSITRRQKAPAP
jgi:hypothetical protein